MSEMAEIGERSQRLVSDFLTRQAEKGMLRNPDPMNIGKAFMEMTTAMMTDPAKLVRAQIALWQDYMDLWKSTSERMMGLDAPQTAEPDKGDRRFRDGAWSENEVFNFIKQSYLLTSRWLQSTVSDVDGLEDETAKKLDFFTRQFVNALSPSNFVMTNPEVLRTTVESGGENLINGLKNLLDDLERGKGKLNISMTDKD
ncbi:MAG TPA: class I poly(R)-hydroxyalkanoic acid synthase, partial [Alphaproteobacteria bacterium]|nr:class I poly(R)-hydroxyalkanoic acid synthase [Alphaproteobacteria bacterium]